MTRRGARGGEDELIARIAAIFPTRGPGLAIPIGDDAAVLDPPPGQRLVLTTDQMVEGVHFKMASHPPRLLGDKALSVNLSDVAAMGATPRWALLSLLLPPELSFEYLQAVLRGMSRRASRSGTILVGGNITRSKRFAIDLTLIGTLPRRVAPLTRSGARPGDRLFVSGSLGGSAVGLKLLGRRGVSRGKTAARSSRVKQLLNRHFRPEPELELGGLLARHGLATAAMDLSDGISRDLRRLCRASGVGAVLSAESIPLDAAARSLVGSRKALEMALHGGEDYRLLYCVPPGRLNELFRKVPARKRLEIGRLLPGPAAVWLEDAHGSRRPLPVLGHDHLLNRDRPRRRRLG